MKRARGNYPRNATTVVKTHKETKKKAKLLGPADEKAAKEVVVKKAVEEPKEADAAMMVAEETAEMDDYEWAGLWSGVEEEIAWATCWCPFWEMEAIEDDYNALYEDVLWDYDIWDLKASGNIAPNP